MRIAYTCQDISVAGGLERILVDKANAMAARGHDVCMIVNNPPGSRSAYALHPDVKFVDISLPQPEGLYGTLRFKWRQNAAIRRALKSFRPDIVVGVPSWLTWSILFAPARLVLESHNARSMVFISERRSAYKRLKVAVAERRAAAVVALTREDAAAWTNTASVKVIPNFSNVACAENGATRHGAVAVGRLVEQKDFSLLIEAWGIVAQRHPDYPLRIFGEGPLLEDLSQRIATAGLEKSVALEGRTSDVAAIYAASDFLVMSSAHEGLPLVLIEAMQCGCPCVATDCKCGPREIISDGSDGLLVPYRDLSQDERARALAEAICRLIENPEQRRNFGAKARENAARFSKENIMDRWEQLFKDITACG
ncbi:MAG: glycosyltransferase family 4 protein [Muribaculaceae bacterium]|nr:glycosyltransferase family 4 protein [Muribaculaceae bacterium]